MIKNDLPPLVIFHPSGRRGNVASGATIIEAAQQLGADIQNVCGSEGKCGKCKVRIIHSVSPGHNVPSSTEALAPATDSEKKWLSDQQLAAGWRLACQARILADVAVLVPDESRADRQVIAKDPGDRTIHLNPAIMQYTLKLTPTGPADAGADWERITAALESDFGLTGLSIEYPVLRQLPQTLRSDNWEVTVSVRHGRQVVRIVAGGGAKAFGLAVDVGTTSLAAYLCDMATGKVLATESMVNPQVVFGEDVISRISYAMGKADGTRTLQTAVVRGINDLIQALSDRTGVAARDIVDVTCVGNTCMHHLLLGCDPRHLARAPFVPVIHRSVDVRTRDMGITVSRGAHACLLPVIAGFVGADTTAVLIAEAPYDRDDITLIIDVGTNGELILGNRHRLICSSCATGPALEGATIRHGMRAARGAIDAIRIDPETLAVRFRTIGEDSRSGVVKAKGICGSGIIDGVAQMFSAGILKKNGQFNKDLDTDRLRIAPDGPEFVIARPDETATGREIVICLDDVRAIQMAKGAIYAAARLMMMELGVSRLDRIVLAGAFGSFIDIKSAAAIGLFPDCRPADIRAVGNAAGDGARMALLDLKKRLDADIQAAAIEYVELTDRPGFQKEYARAMYFPHMTDHFKHTEK